MGANFTPEMKPYMAINKFRYWCQNVLPLVYDDSLSSYELLCKVIEYLNNAISNVDTNNENVDALLMAYTELQDYVNNYFDGLNFNFTTKTGEPGTEASATTRVDGNNINIELTIPRGNTGKTGPQGPKGEEGPKGEPGPRGEQGLKGDTGPIPTFETTTKTGEVGSDAKVEASTVGDTVTLNFTIPRGEQGPIGPQGPAGGPGSIPDFTATTQTGEPGSNAKVIVNTEGTTVNLAFTIPRGDQGKTGPTGPAGPAGPAAENPVTSVNGETGEVNVRALYGIEGNTLQPEEPIFTNCVIREGEKYTYSFLRVKGLEDKLGNSLIQDWDLALDAAGNFSLATFYGTSDPLSVNRMYVPHFKTKSVVITRGSWIKTTNISSTFSNMDYYYYDITDNDYVTGSIPFMNPGAFALDGMWASIIKNGTLRISKLMPSDSSLPTSITEKIWLLICPDIE